MAVSSRLVRFSATMLVIAVGAFVIRGVTTGATTADKVPLDVLTPDRSAAGALLRQQPGAFVPNVGQWVHRAKFVHRAGAITLFLEERGWVVDHQATRKGTPNSVALRMTFEGGANPPELVGEKKLPGHHNYFLGNDASRWRSHVPRFASVRYDELYPGIGLRLRESSGVPEYDLLLEPGADLSQVVVHVEGATGLSIADDGSLVLETALGSLAQSAPQTWATDASGRTREVPCRFRRLDANRFGFAAPEWDGDTRLTIDPTLIWSTYLGGYDGEDVRTLEVDEQGVVTAGGVTGSRDFPTTLGAYDRTKNGVFGGDAYVTRLDPSRTGAGQLLYSTYLGGASAEVVRGLSVDDRGVLTVGGDTASTDFPTTLGAFDRSLNGAPDVFVSRLDPSQTGAAQLTYSTYLGGTGHEYIHDLASDGKGVVTVAGSSASKDFPTTSGAYDRTHNGGTDDIIVSRLDPAKRGAAQLVYSTFLGSTRSEGVFALAVDPRGVVTVAGSTSSAGYPVTRGAFRTKFTVGEAVVSRLDPSRSGAAQLVYSTFLGGSVSEAAWAVDVGDDGVVAVSGTTQSGDFPTTPGAFDTKHTGSLDIDAFVSLLDPRRTGSAQLVYSTLLGGSGYDNVRAVDIDSRGVLTVAGHTGSNDFPTTPDAHKRTKTTRDSDVFVSRVDPRRKGIAQLVHSTFLGGASYEELTDGNPLAVDAAGVATVGGMTQSNDFPITRGALRTTYSRNEAFVTRLSMGVPFYADRYELSLRRAGTQTLSIDAGKAHASRLYAILGSFSGTSPGFAFQGVHVPINFDAYTEYTVFFAPPPIWTRFKGVLDGNGEATAAFHVPSGLPSLPGITFHHVYVVFDAGLQVRMASNPVPLRLTN